MPESAAVRDCLAEIDRRVSGELRTDSYSRVLYSTDASIYQAEPFGVLIPRTVEDVHAAVEIAAVHGVPLLPRASGSSLAGQAVNEALVIDMTRHLDRVLEVDTESRRVRVEPGLVLDELNEYLRPTGLQFGPDPASSDRAAMGGIVSNNSTGSHSILYGMTADHVVEMGVIFSDGSTGRVGPVDAEGLAVRRQASGLEGEIYRGVAALVEDEANRETIRVGTPRHWRRCGGYNLDRFVDGGISFKTDQDSRFNLAKLICGGEGTLAVISDLTLALVPLPKRTALALVHFDTLYDALAAVPVMLEADPSAVELLDHLGLALCRGVPEYARLLDTFVEGDPNCLLITEFYGESEDELETKIERLATLLKRERAGAEVVVPVFDRIRQLDVWKVRKVGLGLLMSIKGDHKPIPFIEDAAVPVEHLAEYVTRIERFCSDLGTDVAYYAHASAGCIHIRPLIDTKRASEIAKLSEIEAFSVELLHGYGGALSSEHGDGRARSWINERFFGPDLYRLYGKVKHIFDPRNLLNPGMIVDGRPMTESLRYGESYEVAPLAPHIDFSSEQGFDRAVEMCNGAGVCRKRTAGTMCPSFMVTREEEHSTRGRANALRAALSGVLPVSDLTSERMHRVMDLCVECKACKAECPSSVDMAKIKLEFLARYHQANGIPLRDRLFADVARMSRLVSGPLAPAVNALLRNGLVRGVMARMLGIGRERALPTLAREPFTRWFHSNGQRSEHGAGKVVLFNDTFATFHEPRIAIAATRVLSAAGYEIVLPGHRCCGRPMISKGLVERARAAARGTVERLAPYAEAGVPIVGLEPSCLLTLRDEYLYLLPDEPAAKRIAENAFTLEEFLAREDEAGRLDLSFAESRRHLLLHGHCHQKSLVGTVPARRVLSLPPGHTVSEVDSGCCGMAGSFGYEAEHYEMSLRMAERRLLPAVREAGEQTTIVASGVSCRQQIEHGTGRRALHPAEVLAEALA
jgi:FAD/FMN-containing dehydrogenase/Fe-S oxidoreductase